MDWALASSFAIAALAIVNPVGKVPIWTELTADRRPAVRRRIAVFAVLTATIVSGLFLVAGDHILQVFDIDLASFRIAGGIFLLLTGIAMLQGTAVDLDDRSEDRQSDGDDPRFEARTRFRKIMVPLTIPVLAGPGTITTMVIFGIKAGGMLDYAVLGAILVLIYGLNLAVLFAAPSVETRVDPLVFEAFTRLFGLVIAALAVQFMVEGLGEVFPALLQGDSPIDADVQEARQTSEE